MGHPVGLECLRVIQSPEVDHLGICCCKYFPLKGGCCLPSRMLVEQRYPYFGLKLLCFAVALAAFNKIEGHLKQNHRIPVVPLNGGSVELHILKVHEPDCGG